MKEATIERLEEIITNAHMAGQFDAGVDAGYSNARAYCKSSIDLIIDEIEELEKQYKIHYIFLTTTQKKD